jgi:Protein of unknown function (DUF3987)
MIGDGFHLSGEWRTAAEQIATNMTTSIDPRDLILPGGSSSEIGLERYAREYVAASGRSNLAVVYAIASVGVCTATQGGWVLQCPLKGGGYLEVPPIQYATAVAPSGWRKSTALDAARKPVQRALLAGVRARMDRTSEMRALAIEGARRRMAEEEAGARPDAKQFAQVFNAGICPVTVVKDPTMEALGQILANNGGVGAIWSAEADIFRTMAAYNYDGGTLTPLLDGWSQEGMSTARVGRGMIEMGEVALNLIVLFQQEVFADVTGGAAARIGGTDSFISRGVFGRTWVVRATDAGRYEELAQQYDDNDDFEYHGPDGMALAGGELTPLGAALSDYSQALHDLVEESNWYRMDKALHRAWELALAEHGADLEVPEPAWPNRHELHLDRSARLAYRRVQRMQLAIEGALADDRVDEDVRDVFTPLASRFTQHVMREALTVSLGAGYRTVSAERIRDAATRIVPWRIACTADALLTRASEVSEVAIRQSAQSNPSGADLSAEGVIVRQLARLVQKYPGQAGEGFTRGQVREGVRGVLSRSGAGGAGMGRLVSETLEGMAARSGATGVQRALDTVDATGRPVVRYTIDKQLYRQYL